MEALCYLSCIISGYNILVWKPREELAEKQSVLLSGSHKGGGGGNSDGNRGPGKKGGKRPPKDKNTKEAKQTTAMKTKLKVTQKKS